MKQKLHIPSVLVVIIMFFSAPISGADQAVQALRENEQGPTRKHLRPEYVPGELLVKIKDETPQTTVDALHSAAKVQETKRIGPSGVERIKLPSDTSVEEAASFYETDPNVEYAEPNYFIYFTAIPNDPDFAKLWGLHNTGGSGTADADIDAPEAWDITTGSNDVIIAVTDSGVAHLHPEINPNRWVNTEELNGTGDVDDDDNGYIDDIYGWDFWGNDGNPEDLNSHGTHVAGTIAADGNNGAAITGVNWNAKIMALRVGGMLGTIADATDAIHYAVDNGADVINASWGGGGYSQTLYNAISYANDHGVLFVASAGNDGSDNDSTPHYPSSYELDNIISVAATDQNDSPAWFSNYGAATVDVAAPGVIIYSSIPQFTYGTPVVLYTETFDPFPDSEEWVSGGINNSWAFIAGTGFGNTNCLEDSPAADYFDDTSSVAGYGTPFTSVKDNRYTLSFKVKRDLGSGDFLYMAVSVDGNSWFNLGMGWTGSTAWVDDIADLTWMADLLPSFYFGFWLLSDESTTGDGVYIDNLELYREPKNISAYSYGYKGGTSMAAPHVSGVVALVKAQNPGYTYLQVRDAVLNSVDEIASLSGQVATGGRVNAFEAVTYLAPPENVAATAGDGAVTLSWNANRESALTGYKVLYGTTSALGTELSIGNVTTRQVNGLTNGTRYYFAVRAMGGFPVAGTLEGTDSETVTAIPLAPIAAVTSTPSAQDSPVDDGGGGGGCFVDTAADMWSPTGKPVAPLSFADSLCERRDLVARHPDHNPDHKRSGLKPWLSAVGVNGH